MQKTVYSRDNSEFDHIVTPALPLASVFSDFTFRKEFWDALDRLVVILFGSNAHIWHEGQDGGWIVIEGIKPIHCWNKETLRTWCLFANAVYTLVEQYI